MFKWHIVSSEVFRAGTPTVGDMYYISDTGELYRGSELVSRSVAVYTELPTESIAIGRLYINATTLEGKIYDGTSWTTVIKPVVDEVVDEGTDPVSSKAVIAYVASQLGTLSANNNKYTVSTLTWDSAEHVLTATMLDKETTSEIVFDGLGVSLSYTSATGELQLLDATGNKIGDPINLPLEQFVTAGEYLVDTKQIVLYFDAERTKSVTIDATGLVDIYTGEETSSATVSVSADNKISAVVKISAEDGNTVVLKDDGIYVGAVDLSNYMTLVADATEGNFAGLDANGQVVDSGKKAADFATAEQGAKADTAVQKVVAGTDNGHIAVDGTDVTVYTAPLATAEAAGDVKADDETIAVAEDGTISVKAVSQDVVTGLDEALATATNNANTYTDEKLAENLTWVEGM